MTEHKHRPAGEPLIVSGRQRAAQRGVHTQDLEEVAGDERASYRAAAGAGRDVRHHGECVGKDAGITAQRVEIAPGERHPHFRGVWGGRPAHLEQLGRVAHGIDTEKQGAIEAEDDGDEAEAEPDRDDDSERDQRRTAERARSVLDVPGEGIEEQHQVTARMALASRNPAEDVEKTGATGGGSFKAVSPVLPSSVTGNGASRVAHDAPFV